MMEMDVTTALQATEDWKVVHQRLEVLKNLGLGYLTLGEETPSLSGGEAQRLKLASELGRGQSDSVFVFDEPTIGLHPLDVQTLLQVFQALIDNGATVLVIEHDLDVIRNADYIIDMGPGGGEDGGRVVAVGTPEQIAAKMEELAIRRREKQPLEYPSAGSTFKRPEGHFAGQLIMEAGLRGYSVGGAKVSEKHCGFIINTGNATAEDVKDVIWEVQRRVKERFHVELEPEIKFL